MTLLISTTQLIGQMGYQISSNKKLKNVTHKKASWFEKQSARKVG